MKTKHAVLLWKCTFFFSLFLTYSRIWISFYCSGDSANAVPPTKKLRTRVTNICGDRRGQPNRSAMERPHSGPTTLVIVVQPVPGKYAWAMLFEVLTFPNRDTKDMDSFHFGKGGLQINVDRGQLSQKGIQQTLASVITPIFRCLSVVSNGYTSNIIWSLSCIIVHCLFPSW